jgi:hypothetical protein
LANRTAKCRDAEGRDANGFCNFHFGLLSIKQWEVLKMALARGIFADPSRRDLQRSHQGQAVTSVSCEQVQLPIQLLPLFAHS